MRGIATNIYFSNDMSIGMDNFMKLDVLFCLCYPKFLYIVFYDMLFLINSYDIFALYYQYIEDIEFVTLLEIIVK